MNTNIDIKKMIYWPSLSLNFLTTSADNDEDDDEDDDKDDDDGDDDDDDENNDKFTPIET